jgi:hypothetical protein
MAKYETLYPVQREAGKAPIPPGETIDLSGEDAGPLLDAGAIKPAGASSATHDPHEVGYEGQEAREEAQKQSSGRSSGRKSK